MDFIRNWQPDLAMVLVFIVGGIIEIITAPMFIKKESATRWRIGGIVAVIVGLVLLAIRFYGA
ncbi:MAG: hypothetical protein FWB88_13190 [Defluviitaleaceae bacterium]|nr:hypothetical protein [Defluviitaleaceae bacterium]